MFQSILKVDPFLWFILEEFVDQVHHFKGEHAFIAELVLSLYGVFEDVGDGVIIEGQSAG